MTVGLMFRMRAKDGRDAAVARILEDGLAYDVPASTLFALQFDALEFGLLVTFEGAQGEKARVGAQVAAALRDEVVPLLEGAPVVESFDVLHATLAR